MGILSSALLILQRFQQVLQPISINFKHQLQEFSRFASGKALFFKPQQVGFRQVHVALALEAAEGHKKAAADAEAEAKALEAVVKMLQKVIAQMQEELEAMIDAALQSLDVIFGVIDDTQTSQTKIMQSSGA